MSSVAAMMVRVRHAAASIVLAASMATTSCRSAFLVSLEQAAALARYSRQTRTQKIMIEGYEDCGHITIQFSGETVRAEAYHTIHCQEQTDVNETNIHITARRKSTMPAAESCSLLVHVKHMGDSASQVDDALNQYDMHDSIGGFRMARCIS